MIDEDQAGEAHRWVPSGQVPTTELLRGLRVVEVSAFVAAPFAGMTLGRFGADVIRVEQIGGGIDARRWPMHEGRSLYREGLDQGKRSIAVDLRSERGRELAAQLICSGGEAGGIVLTNLASRGCLTYEQLRRLRSDAIMLSIVGTPDGSSAVDYTVNASLGFTYVTGPSDCDRPVNHVLPAWDLLTGAIAATTLLAAERERRRTGSGAFIELALSDVALDAARSLGFLAEAALIGPRGRHGNEVYGTYGRDFRTLDGREVMVCALTPRQWRSLTAATGLVDDIARLERDHGVDFCDEGARFRFRNEITALIEPWVGTRPLNEVARQFDGAGVLWSLYRTFEEVVAASPEVVALPLPAPTLGADTDVLLALDLGLGPDVIADLRSQRVVA